MLSPDRHLAAFDLENTLIASNVVESYTFLATRRLDNAERLRYVLRTVAEAPRLLKLDRADRTDFLRHFYRRYENAPVEQIAEEAGELLSDVILTKSFPAGLRRVREHRALGHRTMLITGALDFAVDCLRPLFDEIIAAEMTVKPDGTYSGEMTAVPPTGEARAQVMADYAAAEGLDLAEAVAYADSSSDLPMLEAVGFPVAVNPETRLAAIARKRGWLVEHWSKASGAGGRPFPMAPVMVERERRRVLPMKSWLRRCRAVGGPRLRALPRIASAIGTSAAVRVGAARVPHRRSARTARRRMAPRPHPAVGDLRVRPVDDRGSRLDVLRRRRVVPVRARATRSSASSTTARGSPSNRCSVTPPAASPRRSTAPRRATATTTATSPPGDLEPGIQTGFCTSTGGGWAPEFVAHESQLHRLGDVPDERAVLIEPLAGGIHAALLAARGESVHAADEPIVAVLGAGTMGLAAIAGLVRYVPEATVVVGARYPHQQREARRLGAHDVVPAGELTRAVRRHDGCRMIGDALSGGAHAVIDAVGSNDSIAAALQITRPRGRTVLMGMPAEVTLDLTGLWHRETELVGAYTYGTERLPDGTTGEDVRPRRGPPTPSRRNAGCRPRIASPTTSTPSPTPPTAGRRGAIKIAFDLREGLPDAATWIRARRRPLDPADAVLARRGVLPGEAAARPQPGDLRPRAAAGDRRHRRRRSATPSTTRSTPSRCAPCCSPG